MKKDLYVEKFKAQLDEWSADLDKLDARARGAKADARIKYEIRKESIRQRRDEARRMINEIQAASEGAWEQLKDGADDAWDRLKAAVMEAKSQFK